MKTHLKLGGSIAVLAAVLTTTFGIGNAVGPVGQTTQRTNHSGPGMTDEAGRDQAGHDDAGHGDAGHGDAGHGDAGHGDAGHGDAGHGDAGHGGHGGGATSQPGGLMISEHGYTLDLDSTILEAGRTRVTFRVLGPGGQPVTGYEPTHDKELHFIAVRRDMTGFQHVHPTVDEAGTWTTELDLTPGVWRFFADFQPAKHGGTMTLGSDVSVTGNYQPQPLAPAGHTAKVDDYAVTLKGQLTPGESSELTLTVSRHGKPVTDLQPYLAAYGHLVALRSGDLAYLHVHPEGEPGDGTTDPGPDITFYATAPSAGPYRLYLDFKHDGVVRTAEFTAQATSSTTGFQRRRLGSRVVGELGLRRPRSLTTN